MQDKTEYRGEADLDPVVGIAPVRVVVLLLGLQRYSAHPTPGSREVPELKLKTKVKLGWDCDGMVEMFRPRVADQSTVTSLNKAGFPCSSDSRQPCSSAKRAVTSTWLSLTVLAPRTTTCTSSSQESASWPFITTTSSS